MNYVRAPQANITSSARPQARREQLLSRVRRSLLRGQLFSFLAFESPAVAAHPLRQLSKPPYFAFLLLLCEGEPVVFFAASCAFLRVGSTLAVSHKTSTVALPPLVPSAFASAGKTHPAEFAAKDAETSMTRLGPNQRVFPSSQAYGIIGRTKRHQPAQDLGRV